MSGAGVLADYFDLDPVLIRLAWVVLSVLSGGIFALAYLLLWIIVPSEGQDYAGRETMRAFRSNTSKRHLNFTQSTAKKSPDQLVGALSIISVLPGGGLFASGDPLRLRGCPFSGSASEFRANEGSPGVGPALRL